MKKILSLTLLSCLATGVALAEQQPCPGPMGGPGAQGAPAPSREMLKNRYGIDDEKAAEMEKLMNEQREKHRQMREQHRAEMQKQQEEMRERMKAILGEERMKQIEERRAQRQAARGPAQRPAWRDEGIDAMPIPGPWRAMPTPPAPPAPPVMPQ